MHRLDNASIINYLVLVFISHDMVYAYRKLKKCISTLRTDVAVEIYIYISTTSVVFQLL